MRLVLFDWQVQINETYLRVKSVVNTAEAFTPLHAPEFDISDEQIMVDCVRSGWVSSVGNYVDEFEKKLASVCGTTYAVAVVNGTTALQIALQVVGVKPGDEVLIPSFTFVATANAVCHLGAVPHFIDINERTLGVDPSLLSSYLKSIVDFRDGISYNKTTGRRISALVPMHTFGHSVDMDPLIVVADEFNLIVVEDAAEALGSVYKDRKCGNLGKIAALSFNGNKIITTGGGGAILTNDSELAFRAKHITTTAKVDHPWLFEHDEIAYNFRMPNINAALGVSQLLKLDRFVDLKRQLAERYIDKFSDHEHVNPFIEPKFSTSNYWLNTLILSNDFSKFRDAAILYLNDRGLMSRPAWKPLHSLNIFSEFPRADLYQTDNLYRRVINIPSSPKLGLNSYE